jgi:deferrochelatase/peroxidase EfeB
MVRMSETPEADPTPDAAAPRGGGVTRRGLFGALGAGAAGLAIGAGAGAAVASAASARSDTGSSFAFFGEHQAGITTPAQDRLHFASFDVAAGLDRDGLRRLLAEWTVAAALLTQGREVGDGAEGSPFSPPDDTGEALGLGASGLTITFGVGPTLFEDADGTDRFGIASRRPTALAPLPRFAGDALVPGAGGGDLCIQACADDPQVAVHAIRNLSRIAFGRASLRWSQLGFGRTSSTSTSQATPRNLFGFKDGTANLKSEEKAAVSEHVWVQPGDEPAWMVGGTYLVTRTIRMLIESWDRVQLGEQEGLVGRDKVEGAPLSGGSEFTELDLAKKDAAGSPAIPVSSHVRLAHPSNNGGARLLRRGYNYVDGNDELGRMNAGLFFISFQRSPQQFIDVQRSLAADGLNEYVRHVGSSVFAVPPGVQQGASIGDALFA